MFAKFYNFLATLTLLLALGVVMLGAYVRLSNAGLACPDWPGCFGEWIAPWDTASELAAQENFPHIDVHSGKAWREMIHRYAGGLLGMLVLLLALLAPFLRQRAVGALFIVALLVGTIVTQVWLGKLTVDYLLQPEIVVGHLLGGMTLLALLLWLVLHTHPKLLHRSLVTRGLKRYSLIALAVLVVQMALGGWTSANYAGYACPDFPWCQKEWLPSADFKSGFTLHGFQQSEDTNFEGGLLSLPARTAIHLAHRLGALICFFVLLALGIWGKEQTRVPLLKKVAGLLLLLLFVQIAVGIAMVIKLIPLSLAVLHNVVAALLWLTTVAYVFVSWKRCG